MKKSMKAGLIAFGVFAVVFAVAGSRNAQAHVPPLNTGTPLPATWNDYPWEIEHKVRDGEFLYMIAGYYYRDGRKWNWIYETNREKVVDPNKIKPGTVLTIRLPRNWEPMMPYSVWYVRMREQYSGSGTGGMTTAYAPGVEAAEANKPEGHK